MSPTRLTTAQLSELRFLRDRAIATLGFVAERAGLGGFETEMRQAIEVAFSRQDLKGLRVAIRDLREVSDSLTEPAGFILR